METTINGLQPEKVWTHKKHDRKKLDALSARFHFPELVINSVASRGMDTPEKLEEYIRPSVLGLYSPFYFRDMRKAALRVLKAVDEKKGILIFGDKDVDGVTATSILYKMLEKLEANVVYRVPEGTESYGISRDVIQWAAMNEFELIITVDCGITSIEEAEYAKSLGIDLIITDHHEPREILPNAYAVINPKIKEDSYPFAPLSGASVSLKLALGMGELLYMKDYSSEDIVSFDLETTGLNPTRDEIIELGAVRVSNGVTTGRFQVLVKPSRPVSAEITQITGITNAMLDTDGIDVESAMKQFVEFCGKTRIIGHNIVEFDMRFVSGTLKKLGMPDMTNPLEDTLKMARVMCRRVSDHKLATVAESLGIVFDRSVLHRSMADSELCAEVYRRLLLQRSNRLMDLLSELLPLAAVGTIADIMPLVNENRVIVKNGLRMIGHSSIGLISLLRAVNLSLEKVTSKEISWNISPLLNSPGRIGDASYSVELLICSKIKEAEELVQEIVAKDTARKGIVDDGVGIVNANIDINLANQEKIIFLASHDFTRGTTGLLANRLSMQHHLPAVIVTTEGESASGSVRAPGGFDVVRMLESARPLFLQFGGHKAAGGFILKKENLEAFHTALINYMKDFNPADFREELAIDAKVDTLDEINLQLVRYLENILEPIGNGNDYAHILIPGVKILSLREIGKTNNHVLLNISKGGKEISAVGWNWAERLRPFTQNGLYKTRIFDIVGSPEINKYQGNEEIRLSLVDIMTAG